jgi:DnaJ-class molecular chaperone
MLAQSQGRCDVCNGEGKRVLKQCGECHGKKFKEREKELAVHIRPGMQEGQTLVFAGECSDTADFEEPGDVVLTLKRVDGPAERGEEDAWEWRGADLWIRRRITFAESVLGFYMTLEGHPSGTPLRVEWFGGPLVHGAVLQAMGRGMPTKDGAAHGNCYIQLVVASPELRAWTAEERAQLRTLFGIPEPSAETSEGGADVVPLTPHILESKPPVA